MERGDAVETRLTLIWQVYYSTSGRKENCSSTNVRFEGQVLTLGCYAV